jgi:hypothetical protein
VVLVAEILYVVRIKALLVQGVEEDADHTDEPAPRFVLLFNR